MSSASDKAGRPPKAAASWFPGHMAAGSRAVGEIADLIEAVVEVRDARLPRATAVASLHAKLRGKPSFVLLNRADLAEPQATKAWLHWLHSRHIRAFAGVGTSAASMRALRAALASYRARRRPLRIAVVGAPNTGKSSVINALARRKRAAVANRPGVTRHVQWLRVGESVQMLDTPGLLAPKIIDRRSAWQLALCGSIAPAAFAPDDVIERFADWLADRDPALANALHPENFAKAHGMLRKGGELDAPSAARKIISMFGAGAFGRFTFEFPEIESQP